MQARAIVDGSEPALYVVPETRDVFVERDAAIMQSSFGGAEALSRSSMVKENSMLNVCGVNTTKIYS